MYTWGFMISNNERGHAVLKWFPILSNPPAGGLRASVWCGKASSSCARISSVQRRADPGARIKSNYLSEALIMTMIIVQ